MGELSPRIRFKLQDDYGKDFEIEIDLEYDPYQKSFLGIKLENKADKDGWHVYITKVNPKKLFYQKLLELEETLPAGDKMMIPFKIKSLTITQGMTQIYQGTGPAQEMLSELRSLVPAPTMSAAGADFVASPPAATDGWFQNVAAALGLSAVVGGSMITDSGYAPAGGMPMVGDVDLGSLGATQPEYGSMNPDFVMGDGESVIPSFKVAQTMVGDGQSTGLDLETIGYLTDKFGNFMIRTHYDGDRSMMDEDEMIDQDTEIMTVVGAAIKAVIAGLENYAETYAPGMNDKERIARSAAAAVAVAVNKHQGRGIDLTNNEVLQMAIDNYNSRWPVGGPDVFTRLSFSNEGPKIPVIRYGAQTLSSARGYTM